MRNIMARLIPRSLASAMGLQKLGLFLLIPFASFTSHTWMPLPPNLLLFGIAGIITCLLYDAHFTLSERQSKPLRWSTNPYRPMIRTLLWFTAYMLVTQYFIDAPLRRYIGTLVSPVYGALILLLVQDMDKDYLKKLTEKFIRYTVYLFIIEALIRYGVSIYKIMEGTNYYQGFYRFKFYSPIYVETNGLSIHLISMFFFVLWWAQHTGQNMRFYLISLFVLVVLCLSRTSIISVPVGLVYFFLAKRYSWKNLLIAFGLIGCLAGFCALFFLESLVNDPSFQSKYQILYAAIDYFQHIDLLTFLFGIGFTLSNNVLDIYAHNYFLVYLIESGLFGLLIFVWILWLFIRKTNGLALIVILPLAVQILSSAITYVPFLYTILPLILIFSNNSLIQSKQLC
ncbi:polymerase [Bacteroidia bacterium]|nr:polymerase [Bacteroidia bacterium]